MMVSDEEISITYDEFSKVHLKIGKVIHAEIIPGMKKVFKVIVDIGNEQRDLAVGAAAFFYPRTVRWENSSSLHKLGTSQDWRRHFKWDVACRGRT